MGLSLEMLKTVGISMGREEFQKVGERIYNLTRMFSVREGVSRKDDYLPARMYESRRDTEWKITREDFDKLLDNYYELRGWDKNGVPTKETLKSLGLEL